MLAWNGGCLDRKIIQGDAEKSWMFLFTNLLKTIYLSPKVLSERQHLCSKTQPNQCLQYREAHFYTCYIRLPKWGYLTQPVDRLGAPEADTWMEVLRILEWPFG